MLTYFIIIDIIKVRDACIKSFLFPDIEHFKIHRIRSSMFSFDQNRYIPKKVYSYYCFFLSGSGPVAGLGQREHRDLRSGHPLQPHLLQPLQAGTYRLSYVLDRIEPFERNPSAVPREKRIVKITELLIALFSAAYKKKPKFVIIF